MRKIMPAGKKIALGFGAAVAATAVIHLVSCATLDRITQYVYTDYTSEKISPALDGYKLVFISDIHDLPEKKLMETVEQINKENADLMLIGGDFPRGEAMLRAFAYLSGINAADGIFGVGGNHDRPSEYFSAMESFGITPLRNNGIFTLENLYLCGVEDKKRGNADVRAAVSGAKPDDFTVLLSHSPDVLFDQDIGIPALALSGHTHGGHVTFFGVYAPLLSLTDHVTAYGGHIKSGWIRTPKGTDLLVSNGVGTHHYVPRVFARPQVMVVTLRRGAQD